MKREPNPSAHPYPANRAVKVPVTLAAGDGIGPEIMQATLAVLEAAGAALQPEWIDIGETMYRRGHSSGIAPEAWESLRRTKVFLKAPVTTPAGGGFKSLNVTIRKTLGLYANVRPCVSYEPFVRSASGPMNVVIIRENEEDLYAGIEHRQTDDVSQCLKLITRTGSERIVRHAFEYARAHGRRKVTCMVKDNIMKMTDGLFYQVFEEISSQYPDIERERYIIDIGAARLATRPGLFDVVVTPNLYGDILSDIAAEVSGSVGLAGSANMGQHAAMFEAIHGSAPDIAGRCVANPSGLMLAAVMMLVHIRQADVAQRVHNAWLCAIEDGLHTPDIGGPTTRKLVGTPAFTQAVIERLGRQPQTMAPVTYANPGPGTAPAHPPCSRRPAAKALVGVDIFVHARCSADELAKALRAANAPRFELQMITNRGVKVWPGGFPETSCTDHWRCRFMAAEGTGIGPEGVVELLGVLVAAKLDVIKTENLFTFDGERGFALGQGQ